MGNAIVDWNFYLIVFAALFGIFVTLLTVRFFVSKRLEKLERKRQIEEEARQTAESNSGL
jgi:Tfp pilus assembly protein PilO